MVTDRLSRMARDRNEWRDRALEAEEALGILRAEPSSVRIARLEQMLNTQQRTIARRDAAIAAATAVCRSGLDGQRLTTAILRALEF